MHQFFKSIFCYFLVSLWASAMLTACASNTTSTTMKSTTPAAPQAPLEKVTAQGTNALFRHSVSVKAPAQRVWAIWMDVPNWHTWDTELKAASATAPLAMDVEGKITPLQGPSSSFKVVSFESGKQYAFETALPLAKLKVTRFLTTSGDITTFTHEVEFSGFSSSVFASQLGPRFRAALPQVMDKIAAQALLAN